MAAANAAATIAPVSALGAPAVRRTTEAELAAHWAQVAAASTGAQAVDWARVDAAAAGAQAVEAASTRTLKDDKRSGYATTSPSWAYYSAN